MEKTILNPRNNNIYLKIKNILFLDMIQIFQYTLLFYLFYIYKKVYIYFLNKIVLPKCLYKFEKNLHFCYLVVKNDFFSFFYKNYLKFHTMNNDLT